jgi:serine/threonine-protein kinase haspin
MVAEEAKGGTRHVLRGVPLRVASEGLRVTLIDFSLSRLRPRGAGGRPLPVAFSDLEADPEMFAGPKEVQFETYRKMRKAVKQDWAAFQPATNCLWLAYLAEVLLTQKEWGASREERGAVRGFRSRAAKFKRASEALLDELFVGMWSHEK